MTALTQEQILGAAKKWEVALDAAGAVVDKVDAADLRPKGENTKAVYTAAYQKNKESFQDDFIEAHAILGADT
jgi:hypothetical protein